MIRAYGARIGKALLALSSALAIGTRAVEPAMTAPLSTTETPAVVVHSVTDLSHEFSFYADGRFARQYLHGGQNKDARNWGTLHKCDLSNVNLLVLMSGATPCRYVDEDVAAVKAFLNQGGGVVVLGNHGTFRDETVYHLSELASAFGATFTTTQAEKPPVALDALGADKVETYGDKTIELTTPGDWSILVRDAASATLMARRPVGKGSLLVASRGLFGHRPDAKDPINAEWIGPLLCSLAKGKQVDAGRPPTEAGWAQVDNVTKHGSLELHFSDYLKPEADAIVAIYDRCIPVMEKILGVPPSEGMMSSLLLLPTGGGGFSSGHKIGLGIWWGGFPDKEYGMMELIGHEGTHSWVLPFSEPMWNEPIATYVGALTACQLGLAEDGKQTIERCIDGARKHDPEMTTYDIAYGKDVPRNVQWGKTMWIWEELRRQKSDALACYFQAKRRLAAPAKLKKYTPNDCVAVISHAMGRDMFPWFRSIGLTVDPAKASIPLPKPAAP